MTLAERRAALQRGRRWLRVVLAADRTHMGLRRALRRREVVLRIRLVGRRPAPPPAASVDPRAVRFY